MINRFFFICLIVFICLINRSFAQSLNNVVPPSPNAASLGKFGELPTDLYTGIPVINIPLWDIKLNDFNMPISLSYHAGGIKNQEYASNVGLGWALNSGGVITRSINGIPDDCTFGFLNPGNSGEPYIKYGYDQSNLNDLETLSGFNERLYDSEPDFFYFNFNGNSGKFVFDQNKQIHIIPYQKIKIVPQFTGFSITEFTVTTENGDVYLFSEKEYSDPYFQTINQYGAQLPSPNFSPCNNFNLVSSWYLKRVTTKNGEIINFYYNNEQFGATNKYSYQIKNSYLSSFTNYIATSVSEGCPGQNTQRGQETSYTINQIIGKRLTCIDFPNGKINFLYETNRADIVNDKMLTKIFILSNQKSIKSLNFNYVYSTSGSFSDVSSASITSQNQDNYRLFLDGITQSDGSNNSLPGHKFTYFGNVPPRQIDNILNADFWGFFNGQNSESVKTPFVQFAKCGTIQKITYPTGGSTTFEYEANDCQPTINWSEPILSDNLNEISLSSYPAGEDPCVVGQNSYPCRKIKYFTINNANATGSNVNLNIWLQAIKPTESDASFWIYNAQGIAVFCSASQGTLPYPSPSSQGNTGTYTILGYSIFLLNGTYKIEYQNSSVTYSPTVYNQNNIEVSWRTTVGFNAAAGGIRIKTLTNFDPITQQINKKTYNYSIYNGVFPTSQSSGFIADPPTYSDYAYREHIGVDCNGQCNVNSYYYSVRSRIIPFPLGTTKNSTVGYSSVSEYIGDLTINTGYVSRKFLSPNDFPMTASKDYPYPIRDFYDWASGLMTEETIYKPQGYGYSPVNKIEHTYNTFLGNNITANSTIFGGITGMKVGKTVAQIATTNCLPYGNSEFVVSYYGIKEGYFRLEQTKKSDFDVNSGQAISTIINYKYDNSAHLYPTRIESVDSKNQATKIEIKYPLDIVPSTTVISDMINRNIISPKIEVSSFLDGNITNKTKTDFSSYGTNILPSLINVQNGNSTLEPRVYFDSYNVIGNLLEQHSSNNLPNSYIYDYLASYPIAICLNASKNQIAYTSFEADGTGNFDTYNGTITTVSSPDARTFNMPATGNKYYNITTTNKIIKSNLTSNTSYIVSYWSKNGSYAVTGGSGSSVQGKTINGWTLYLHTITTSASSTSLTISGTGAIDEVRVYPSIAQMTTYTYESLIGITSQCDVNNRISYYEYDGFGRLELIRDQDRNILKKFCYTYGSTVPTDCTIQCDAAACSTTPGSKCVNGTCEAGQKIYTSTVLINANYYKCTYHFLWSDGSITQNYIEYKTVGCDINQGQ